MNKHIEKLKAEHQELKSISILPDKIRRDKHHDSGCKENMLKKRPDDDESDDGGHTKYRYTALRSGQVFSALSSKKSVVKTSTTKSKHSTKNHVFYAFLCFLYVFLVPCTAHAPHGYVYGAFEQLCPIPDPNRDYVCRSTADMGSDLLPGQSPGFLKCERSYDCCTCSSLLCQDCNTFSVGPSGAYGVKDIVINGREAKLGGAQIKCQQMESCLHSVMNTQIVREIECLGDMSCMGSVIRVFDPVLPGFKLDCSGTF